MRIRSVRRRSGPPGAPFVLALISALCVASLALPSHAQRRRHRGGDGGEDREASITAPAIRVPYVDRPITTTRYHLSLYAGTGFEYIDYYRYYPAPQGRPLWGLGAHFEAMFGITDWLEVAAGAAVRWTDDVRNLGFVSPDRYGRVNREWLPSNLEIVHAPRILGQYYLTNPYARVRFAFLNREPVFVGLDLFLTVPILGNTCFAPSIGVPLHFAIAHRVRIETGVFHEFLFCEVPPVAGIATRYWNMQVPLRVLFQIVPRFWLGLRTGLETVGYNFLAGNWAIPLGIEAGVRLIPRLDLMFQVVAPEFVHTDQVTGRNVWLDRIGGGVAIQAWLL